MSRQIRAKDLVKLMEAGVNILLEGEHGVGKTAMVKEAAESANLNMKYFSAATMDPWLDFLGIPKAILGDDGEYHLKMIQVREIQNYEVLFFDEFNRAPKAVRNAVMELIQFKSINGVEFNKLRCVVAAINPWNEDEDYDVEKLDPAIEDRFHYKFVIPNKPDVVYFNSRYGEVGRAMIDWWKGLSTDNRKAISPRRMSYFLDLFEQGLPIENIYPETIDLNEVRKIVLSTPIRTSLESIRKIDPESKKFKEVASKIYDSPNNIDILVEVTATIQNKEEKEKLFTNIMKHASPEIFHTAFSKHWSQVGHMFAKAASGNPDLCSACLSVRDVVDGSDKTNINNILSAAWGPKELLSGGTGVFNPEWISATGPFVPEEEVSEADKISAYQTLRSAVLQNQAKTDLKPFRKLLENKMEDFINLAQATVNKNFTVEEAITILEFFEDAVKVKREVVFVSEASMGILNSACKKISEEKGIRPSDIITTGVFKSIHRVLVGVPNLSKFLDKKLEEEYING